MPRTFDDIIKHAEEIADQFEPFEPSDAPQDTLSRLRMAAIRKAAAEREIFDAVEEARAERLPWSSIGSALGTSGQAAQQRYTHH